MMTRESLKTHRGKRSKRREDERTEDPNINIQVISSELIYDRASALSTYTVIGGGRGLHCYALRICYDCYRYRWRVDRQGSGNTNIGLSIGDA